MKVTLVAHTSIDALRLATLEYEPHPQYPMYPPGYSVVDADELAEFAGRACYQSWNRPNPKTASNDGYLEHILEVGHESVLEHASATFYIEGVSRSLTHELIRHRHLSFSQLSQRYVDEVDAKLVVPPALASEPYMYTEFGPTPEEKLVETVFDTTRNAYGILVDKLMKNGLPRKQAREAARAVLPNATETKIVVTGNHRAWRDVLKKRWHVAADAEIRALAGELLTQLRTIAPNTYQDIPEVPYGSQQ